MLKFAVQYHCISNSSVSRWLCFNTQFDNIFISARSWQSINSSQCFVLNV